MPNQSRKHTEDWKSCRLKERQSQHRDSRCHCQQQMCPTIPVSRSDQSDPARAPIRFGIALCLGRAAGNCDSKLSIRSGRLVSVLVICATDVSAEKRRGSWGWYDSGLSILIENSFNSDSGPAVPVAGLPVHMQKDCESKQKPIFVFISIFPPISTSINQYSR